MKKFILPALAALVTLSINLNAATLSLGDSAPALKASQWVKGEAVPSFEADKTYVVEFWATWCGPCKVSIPHLTELAHQFKDVTFIGVDVWERGDNIESTVKKFVNQMGDKMDYRVAMDTDDTFMANNWMKAADQNGIPAAFVVQKGKVVWIGHPMGGLEETLKEIAAGKYDLATAKKRSEAQKKVEAFYQKALKGADEAELEKEGKELEALDKEIGGLNPGKPFVAAELIKQAKFSKAMRAYQQALMNNASADEVAKAEADARALAPKPEQFETYKKQLLQVAESQRESKMSEKVWADYVVAVGENGDKEKAAELAKKLVAMKLKDAATLNEMAWSILTDEKIKSRDLDLAAKLAKAGVDASEGKEPAVLDTYAKALFDSGKIADAVEAQKKAVAACEDETMKTELSDTLKKYQAAADKAK